MRDTPDGAMSTPTPEQSGDDVLAERHADFTRRWIESQHAITGYVSMHVHDYATVEDIVQ